MSNRIDLARVPVRAAQPSLPRGGLLKLELGKPHAKGYRAVVGKVAGARGVLVGKRFWLGTEPAAALPLLRAIKAEWALIERSGGRIWTSEALTRIEVSKRQAADKANTDARFAAIAALAPAERTAAIRTFDQPAPAPHQVPRAGSTLLLSKAIQGYIDRRREEVQANQLSVCRLTLIRNSLDRLLWVLDDVPLALIGEEELRRTVLHFAGRPVSPYTHRSIAADTARETIYFIRKLFEDLADRKLWMAPKPIEKLFEYRRDKLNTDEELEAQGEVKVFTLDELAALWRNAGEGSRAQLFMALALNTGFTQHEIATLRRLHCHLDGPKPYIQRVRHKTKVRGKWRLWPETVALLRKHMAGPNPADLALLHHTGRPLVTITETARHDVILRVWLAVRAAAQAAVENDNDKRAKRGEPTVTVRPLSFKYLRKTGANLIRKIAGRDTAEVFLAHAAPKLGRRYHNPDYKRLAKSLRKLRQRLIPVLGPLPLAETATTCT